MKLSLFNTLSKRIAAAIAGSFIVIGLSGCSSLTDDKTELPSIFSVFATLESHGKTGAIFTVQDPKTPDAAPIRLTTNANLEAEKLETGQRYIIVYTNGDGYNPYIEGAIDLMHVLKVGNGDVQIASKEEINAMRAVAYTTVSCFRTGDYVNVELRVPTTSTPKAFNLYADRATLDNPRPSLYLVYDVNSTGLSSTTAYGSFNIAEVWDAPDCTGVTVTMADNSVALFEKK
ncbi:MAG: hypothetical protein K2M61_05665 [Muribaculaceae bacterium]|nr:hypothetical protein [Muribaculaceae bacterium]